jgi:ComF family protein
MYKLKKLLRMYNQAQILAEEIQRLTNSPTNALLINTQLYHNILRKTRWTKSQTTLSKAARKNNIHGSIEVVNRAVIKNKKILLIDDVVTTGSTINHISHLLKKYGAKEVHVLSIASRYA